MRRNSRIKIREYSTTQVAIGEQYTLALIYRPSVTSKVTHNTLTIFEWMIPTALSGLGEANWQLPIQTTFPITSNDRAMAVASRGGGGGVKGGSNLIRLHKRSSARGFSACYAAKIQTRSPNSWLSHWKIHWSCIDFLNIISPGVITRRPWTSEGTPKKSTSGPTLFVGSWSGDGKVTQKPRYSHVSDLGIFYFFRFLLVAILLCVCFPCVDVNVVFRSTQPMRGLLNHKWDTVRSFAIKYRFVVHTQSRKFEITIVQHLPSTWPTNRFAPTVRPNWNYAQLFCTVLHYKDDKNFAASV